MEAARQLGPAAARSRRSASSCGRGSTGSEARPRPSPRRWSDGSRSSPRRRGRWSASPSWPIGRAGPIAWPSSGAARPRSSGRWRPTGTASGATSRSAPRPTGPSLARLAEAAGRPHEARALYAWALKADPGEHSAREGLARLDRADAQRTDRPRPRRTIRGPSWRPLPGPERAESSARTGGELAFTDDAEAVGLRFVYDNAETPLHQLPEPFGGGLALLDYDGDGWLDVYCVQGGPFAPSSDPGSSPARPGDRLFHNRGDGTFEDVTDRSGIGRFPRGHGHGVAVGDIDGDGHPDVFVTRWRSYALYRNRGDGTFEDVTDAWGLGGRRDWPTSAALADLDGDGDLDLYVCHYAAWDLDNPRICRDPKTQAYLNCSPLAAEALPDHLFRNDGGRFVDVTAESGDRRPRRPRPRGGRRRSRRGRPRGPVRRQRLLGQFPVPQPRGDALRGGRRTPPVWPAMLRETTRPAWGSPRATSTATGSSTWPSPTSTASRRRIYRNLGGGVFIDATASSRPGRRQSSSAGLRGRLPRRRQRWPARPGLGQRARQRPPAQLPLPDARAASRSAAPTAA